MKFGIMVGSHRKDSQSSKVAAYIQKHLTENKLASSTYVLNCGAHPLDLWDEGMWSNDPKWQTTWGPISAELKSCDAFVVIAPEYAGMVPAALKNVFLFCSKQELSHKPGLIVGVSSGMGGAYPIVELRSSSYKNTQICYIPEHIIVRHAEKMLNDANSAESVDDQYIRNRIAYALKQLECYGRALVMVRESGVFDPKKYAFGL